MIVKFNELKVGDEVIVPLNSKMIFGKVLRFTKKSAVISTKIHEVRKTITNNYGYKPRTWIERTYECAPVSEHNSTKYVNHYRDFWVVRREGILMDI